MKLVVANWKMNPKTLKEAKRLFGATIRASRTVKGTEVVICPPFCWLSSLPHRRKSPWLGSQDVFWETETGAFTGEISAAMLKDLSVRYVIIGHSERKKYLKETDQMINKKVLAALKAGLKVVLCIGEWSRDEDMNVIGKILEEQLLQALEGVTTGKINDIAVTYEPVWAISTSAGARADTPDDALQAVLLIRKLIARKYSRQQADKISVLYGGSVNEKNVAAFVKEKGIDGVLVGGASQEAKRFAALIKNI